MAEKTMDKTWKRHILKRLSDQRDEGGLFCDAFLQTDDGTQFNVHRIGLAYSSLYFENLFVSPVGPPHHRPGSSDAPKPIYIISDVSATVLKALLDYIYKEELNLSLDNIEQLLPLVDRFCIDGLIERCSIVLAEMIGIQTVVRIYKISNNYEILDPVLKRKAKGFLVRHIVEVVSNSSDYGRLDFGELNTLLGDDELDVSNESDVFKSIVTWIGNDEEDRSQHFANLLRNVRIRLVDPSYASESIVTHDYFRKNFDECLSVLCCTKDASVNRPRIPSKILLAIGGWSSGAPTNIIETYDNKAERWSVLPYGYSSPRAYHGVAIAGGYVYLIGGFDGREHFNSVHCFDPLFKTWSEKSSMHHRRCYVSVCALGELIYALGGYNGSVRLKSGEFYDRKANQWTEIRPMNTIRSDASAAVLNGILSDGHSSVAAQCLLSILGKVYVVGGFTGEGVLRSVEVYDPQDGFWTLVRDMYTPRSGVSCIVFDSKLFVIGGFDGLQRLSSCERYNPQFNQWTIITMMMNPRSNFSCAVLDNEIYVLGGFDGMMTTALVESYDVKNDVWKPRESMLIDRSALKCCVLEDLPNTKDFLGIHDFVPEVVEF